MWKISILVLNGLNGIKGSEMATWIKMHLTMYQICFKLYQNKLKEKCIKSKCFKTYQNLY